MTRLNKKIHNFVATLFVILFFVFIFFAGGGVATVYAATSSNTLYTNVIDDLKKDSGFKPSNYPENAEDYGLQVIQLAESADKELFIYVYQPSGQTKNFTACSVNISTTINDNISFINYKLQKLNSNGVFFKYKVSDFTVKNAALDLIVGKDRQGNVQKAMQGGCVYATGRISIENSYINAGIYSSLDAHLANFYAVLQGQGGTTCTDSVVYAESDVLQAGRTICLDGGDTTFSVKNSIFKAKSNQYAFSGYKYAKPTFESSLVELESKDIVMRGPTFGTISGFTKITATDKNGKDTTYKPGDDLSTLSTDSRKVMIESQIHSHCVCGGENAAEGHTVHYPLMWTPWTKTDSLPTAAGNYYLTGNVLLKSNSDYSMPDGVQICLNGYTIRSAGGTNKPTLYANGGTLTVTDCSTRGAVRDIKMSSGELLMYGGRFVWELIIGETGAFTAADRVGIGAEVTNKGFIFGGIFDGAVINDGGTIEGGTFNARVNLKSGDVIGGIYYGRVTYGGAVIHDSACRYLTFDTDGGSAMDAQRILRGQKATPPTENPVKTGYIFSGWTGFDYTKPMLENAKATAIWTVCDHSGNTTQLSCTDPVACSVCNGTIAALGHDFSASVWHHDNYTHWKKCSRCDERNEENPHDWDSGRVTVPSTCLTEGNRVFTCDECGATKNEPIQASGHSWDQEWQHNATHHWHECLNTDCDVKNNDSVKDGYGAHTDGSATCTEKAVCEVCSRAYGELDANNHADLRHIEAKAATKDAEGNIEYWHCEGCGKYYADAAASKEITEAETVTAKLPDDPRPTGDNSGLALWSAMLFICGGVAIGMTAIGKKKKRSAK